MAVVNVQKYNKAEKPVFEEAKEVNNDLGMAVSAIGRGIQQYGHLRQIENHEDKTQAIKDFTEFQGETNAKIDELSSTSGENFIKDANDYYIKAKNKRLKDKSSAYRTAFEELSSNNYRKISPEIIKKNTQNSLIRMADNVELAAKNLINNSNDTGTMYQINDILNNQIDGMDLPDWQRTQFKHQITREITSSVAEKMIQQDPVSARKFIENDKRFQNLFNEQEIQGFYKVADDQLFNNFVDSNVEQTISILNDKEKAKKVFKSFEYSDIEKYKTKAKNIFENQKKILKLNEEIKNNNAVMLFNQNPTQANYEKIILENPTLNKKQREIMQENLNFVAKFNERTVDNVINPYINNLIENLDNIDLSSNDAMIKSTQTALSVKGELMRQNEKGFLSKEDYLDYNDKLTKGFQKEMIQFLQDSKPDWKPLLIEGKAVSAYSTEAMKNLTKEERQQAIRHQIGGSEFLKDRKIAKLVNKSMFNYISYIQNGDYDNAKKVLDDAKKEVVYLKYPDLKGLKEGGLFSYNGIVYTFQGISGTEPIVSVK